MTRQRVREVHSQINLYLVTTEIHPKQYTLILGSKKAATMDHLENHVTLVAKLQVA